MNYPPNMNMDRVNPPPEWWCPKCQAETMQTEYFWKDGVKGQETGDLICEQCDYREKN